MKENIASAYCDDLLGTMDGVKLAKLISVGKISAVEAMETAITRARKVNPTISAIATETFESALYQVKKPINAPFRDVSSFIEDARPWPGGRGWER